MVCCKYLKVSKVGRGKCFGLSDSAFMLYFGLKTFLATFSKNWSIFTIILVSLIEKDTYNYIAISTNQYS
jgi:hypothetical protein